MIKNDINDIHHYLCSFFRPEDANNVAVIKYIVRFNTFYKNYLRGNFTPQQYSRIMSRYNRGYVKIEHLLLKNGDAVFLYPSRMLIDRFVMYPQILQITGSKRSGKSISQYTLATEWLKQHRDGKVFVWGDMDHITPTNIEGWYRCEGKGFPSELEDPNRDYPALIIYDELQEETAVGFHMHTGSREKDLTARRIRHLGASESSGMWMIYLATTFHGLQRQKRLESDLQLDFRQTGDALYDRISEMRDPDKKEIYMNVLPDLPEFLPNKKIKESKGLACVGGATYTFYMVVMLEWLKQRKSMSKKERIGSDNPDRIIKSKRGTKEGKQGKKIEWSDEELIDVFDRIEDGEPIKRIAEDYNVSRQTIRTIMKVASDEGIISHNPCEKQTL